MKTTTRLWVLFILGAALESSFATTASLPPQDISRPPQEDGTLPHMEPLDSLKPLLDSSEIPGIRLEIGAADSPVCPDCLQMDFAINGYDLYRKVIPEENGMTLEEAYAYELAHSPIGANREPLSSRWYAAAHGGILADVQHIPLQAQTVAVLISKNFPWFGNNTEENYIRAVLEEYGRVLSPSGRIVLLVEDSELGHTNWSRHIDIARQLGFSVAAVKVSDPPTNGIVLVR